MPALHHERAALPRDLRDLRDAFCDLLCGLGAEELPPDDDTAKAQEMAHRTRARPGAWAGRTGSVGHRPRKRSL